MPANDESSVENGCVIALDIGGTWIKGVAVPGETKRWRNPVVKLQDAKDFAAFLIGICGELCGERNLLSVCIATAGEVDAVGERYLATAAHLGLMGTNDWQPALRRALSCPVFLINDAEAFTIGLAERALLSTRGNVGVMAIGTGVGFCLVRDGRWWKPGRRLNLLGTAFSDRKTYDQWISATALAEAADGDLPAVFSDERWHDLRNRYLDDLTHAIASAVTLYRLDELLLGGGLIDAANAAGCDLPAQLSLRLPPLLPRGIAPPIIKAITPANPTLLDGALAVATGNRAVEPARFVASYDSLSTEQPAASRIEEGSTRDVVQQLWQAEQDAGERLGHSLGAIAAVAEKIAAAISAGGRVIYIGCGTSGRVAAIDAVEMPCTYSTAPDRFVAIIAGGVSDAALTIEEDNEEDGSAVPDLLLLQPGKADVVIGISASGTAFFVRSALALAKHRGAYTVLVHEGRVEKQFFDVDLPLGSGMELVSGSTRMKAGTATKKVLNFLSTAAMIRLGKVQHGYMTDFEPTNEKLRKRAERIFKQLTGLPDNEPEERLKETNYRLSDALKRWQQ